MAKKKQSFSEWMKQEGYGISQKQAEEDERKRQAYLASSHHDDDIAPVKGDTHTSSSGKTHGGSGKGFDDVTGGKKDSWFKSGGFSDGVDGVGDFFVDLGQTVGGTIGDIGLGIVKGAGRMVEGVVDAGTHGVAGVADLFGADEFAEKTKEVARYSATDEWTERLTRYVDRYSVLGNKADSVSEGLGQVGAIILTGGAAGAAGLGGAGVSAVTTGAVGVSGLGSGMNEAYEMGATDEQAFLYGATSGTIEAVSELIFGGLGKGIKALGLGKGLTSIDDVVAKKLSNAAAKFITSEAGQKVVGNTIEYAVKSSAEGVEEVISGFGSAIAKDAILLNGENEEKFKKILDDENLLEQFIVGTITSSIAQGADFVKSNKTGKDFVTGLTRNEQAVVDKEVERRVAEQEKGGKKLNAKEVGAIVKQVQDDMEHGQLDIEMIEEVLGGDSYTAFKDTVESEDGLKAEYEQLANIKKSDLTTKQEERLAELKAMNLGDTTKRDDLRKKLNETVFPQLKGSKLAESYNQVAKKGEAFQADLNKYKGKQREAVERAMKSGVLNDTFRSHELVDILSKIEAEKGIVFDYTNNVKLKESGFAIDGKTVNGFANKKQGSVTLNVQSAKAWQSVVGHEITHVLEGTEHYEALRSALYAYAESRGELESRKASLTELYRDMDADIDSELTADLVGDYLFTDKNFVNKLAGNRTLFQKVYDEIKYLWNVATGKEKTEIEKVKDEFDRVWKEYGKEKVQESESKEYSDADLAYSIREEAPPKETGIAYKVFFVKDGKLYPPMVANPDGADTPMGVWLNADVGVSAPPSKTGRAQVKAGGKGTQGGSGSLAFRPGWHLGDLPRASQFDRVNPETGKKELFPENFVWAEVEYAKDVDYQEEAMSYGYTENGKFRHAYAGLPRLPENGYYRYRTNPKPDTVPWVITGAMKVNRLLSDAEVNAILEENGVPAVHRQGGDVGLDKFGFDESGKVQYSVSSETEGKTLYTGSPNTNIQQFKVGGVEGSRRSGDRYGRGVYLTTNENTAKGYAGDSGKVYEINADSLNIFNLNDPITDEMKTTLQRELNGKDKQFRNSVLRNFRSEKAFTDFDSAEQFFDEQRKLWKAEDGYYAANKPDIKSANDKTGEAVIEYTDFANIDNAIGNLTGNELYDALKSISTDDFASFITGHGFDGISFDEDADNQQYVIYRNEDRLNILNNDIAPTPDVQYSISHDTDADYMSAVERGDTETAQRMVDEAAANAGYSVKAYHGTGRADRVGNVFRADRATSGPMAYFTDSKDIASNYARDKADTSLAYDEEYDSYYTQFRVNRNGKNISIPELWKHLSIAERNRIKEVAGHIKFDDDYETIIFDESAQHGNGAWDAYTLNMHRGNALEALVDTWLESGDLYNQEELFLEVLKKAGITDAEYRNPDARYEKVYDTWLKITNPFDTDNANQAFYDGLSSWIDNNDMSVYEKETANADMWDKNNQTPESWLGKLEYDIENGTTHAWTVIPDFVTDYLKAQGYDGIKDKGGKGGGEGHTVWIPFYSEQVKSADPITRDDAGNVIPLSDRFNEENNDIRYSLSKEDEEYAPVGNYSTPFRELALEDVAEDIAPVAPTKATEAPSLADIPVLPDEELEDGTYAAIRPEKEKPVAPKSERIADGTRSDELLYDSLDNHPVQTLEQKIAEKIRALHGEIADRKDLRREKWDDYESRISDLRAKYNAKKNKNTKEASKILQSISRLERMKASDDADFSKRISDLEARIQKMSDPKYGVAMQKRAKMEADAKWAADLLGDTSTWVDKKIGLQYATNTERRNLRDIVRDENGNADIAHADAIDDALNGQYNRDEAAKKRELAKVRDKYAKLKITRAEDAYIQMLGEFRHNPDTALTEEDIKEYYEKHKGKIDTEKVDKVIEMARQDYDSWLDRVNAELKKQGMKEIPYRQGYFPHFTEPKQNFIQKLLNWKTQDNEIPTSIAGLTETFKPTRSWQSFDKRRYSDETDYSFMKGFDSYSEGALDWIYHMDTLQKRRAVENHIRYTHSDEGISDRIKQVYANEEYDANEAQAQIEHILSEAKNPLNNFVQDFTTHTNILAGKKNSLDRTVEQWTNRHIYSVMTNVQNRMSANMVLANVRSALTNFIPITQSWAQVSPLRSLQATKDTIANAIKDDGMINKSTFLTNRLREADKLYQTNWDKVLDKAGIMFEIIDNFSSQVIWRSKYNQNLANGMSESEAIKNADQFAENVMAGRSKGNEPTLFNAKNPFVKAFTLFQLEVNNQYGYLFKDVPNDLKAETEHWKFNLAKGYTAVFVGAYVYNALFEKITGGEAALDPISIVEELLRDLGLFDDDEEKEPDKVVANLVDNVVEELPFVGGLFGGGRIPISSALPYSDDGLTGFIGDVSEGNWGNIGKEMMNPLLNVGLPVGGGQIKKTVQGLNMFSDEHPVAGSYTASGNLRFPVEDTPLNRAQAAVFGQYASENAREYFDNGYAPLKEKQIQEYKDVDIPIKDYWEYRKGLAKQDTLEDKFDYIAGLDLPVEKKNILINNVVDRKEKVDLEGYEDFGSLEEFDFATKNPEKYALAKSVGGYSSYKTYSSALYDIKADKDANGKTINGSRKEKVLQYINNLNADYETKIILFKSEYPSDDTYNRDIVNYLNNRSDLTYDERVAILTELGFRVVNGQIYAD